MTKAARSSSTECVCGAVSAGAGRVVAAASLVSEAMAGDAALTSAAADGRSGARSMSGTRRYADVSSAR